MPPPCAHFAPACASSPRPTEGGAVRLDPRPPSAFGTRALRSGRGPSRAPKCQSHTPQLNEERSPKSRATPRFGSATRTVPGSGAREAHERMAVCAMWVRAVGAVGEPFARGARDRLVQRHRGAVGAAVRAAVMSWRTGPTRSGERGPGERRGGSCARARMAGGVAGALLWLRRILRVHANAVRAPPNCYAFGFRSAAVGVRLRRSGVARAPLGCC